MGLPRKKYVKEDQVGVYHCFTRCVRRAFLCGQDPVTQRDYSHRKQWIVDRLRELAAIFAIEVCAYAVMDNHNHNILRTRPDIVAAWPDREVASRWLTLFPHHARLKGTAGPPDEKDIAALVDNPTRIAQLRKRLCSLSWFMGRLNEYIARAANKEDKVKGRFWESRFKCTALLDDAAITSCMVYVDLNPIRAGLAATPEDSNFTSIQERIRAWNDENMKPETTAALSGNNSSPASRDAKAPNSSALGSNPLPAETPNPLSGWLCPIQSGPKNLHLMQMTTEEYFDLVDRSRRLLVPDKRGAIDPHLVPILLRIGTKPEAWIDTISRFDRKFRLVAGTISSLRNYARQLGRNWFAGISAAKLAFSERQQSERSLRISHVN